MQNTSKGLQIALWSALGAALVVVVVLFLKSPPARSHLPELGVVRPFTLTNQAAASVRLADLKGKVWVADIIFTRCMGPCPKMTEEMRKLQRAFAAEDRLRFVTLTTDPDHDSPQVMRRYAEKFDADPNRWHFLTGPKEEILANLAVESLKMSAVEKQEDQRQNANDLFIHTTMFVLVDKRGKIRGFYESLESGFQEKIQADIKTLLTEGE
jgi:protein SCO1